MKINILFCFIAITLMSCATGINNTVIPTASPSVTLSPGPSQIPSPGPTVAIGEPSSMPSPGQTAGTGTPTPRPTGGTGQYFNSAQFYGTVYDNNKKILALGNVKAEILEIPASVDRRDLSFSSKEDTFDEQGRYVIRGFPADAKIRITVSKEGYTSISRIETIILYDERNVFNFGGEGEDAQYALVKISPSQTFSPLPGDDDYISPFPTVPPVQASGLTQQVPEGEHRVNNSIYGQFPSYEAASLANGEFVVGWQQNRNLFATRYKSDGSPLITKIQIDSYPKAEVDNAGLTIKSNKKDIFAAAYSFYNNETRKTVINAKRFDNQGKQLGGTLEIANDIEMGAYSLYMGENNDLAVAYVSREPFPPGNPVGGYYITYQAIYLHLKKFDQNNNLVFSDKIKLKATFGDQHPRLLINKSGETTLMWNDQRHLSFKKYRPDGSVSLIKGDLIKNVGGGNSLEGTEATSAFMAIDESENYYVTWIGDMENSTLIKKFDKNLETIIPEQIFESKHSRFAPVPIISPEGNIILSFNNQVKVLDKDLKVLATNFNISPAVVLSNGNYLTLRSGNGGIFFSLFDKNGNIIK